MFSNAVLWGRSCVGKLCAKKCKTSAGKQNRALSVLWNFNRSYLASCIDPSPRNSRLSVHLDFVARCYGFRMGVHRCTLSYCLCDGVLFLGGFPLTHSIARLLCDGLLSLCRSMFADSMRSGPLGLGRFLLTHSMCDSLLLLGR